MLCQLFHTNCLSHFSSMFHSVMMSSVMFFVVCFFAHPIEMGWCTFFTSFLLYLSHKWIITKESWGTSDNIVQTTWGTGTMQQQQRKRENKFNAKVVENHKSKFILYRLITGKCTSFSNNNASMGHLLIFVLSNVAVLLSKAISLMER